MKEPVLLPPTHDSLLSAFRTYLTSLGLSSISRKLYSADIARLLSSSAFSNLTLSTLSNPKTYLKYLTQPELSGSTTLLRRNIASLKQFGLFLSHSFSIPNPTQNLSLSTNQANLGLSSTSDKYIKACIQYLKENHLSESSLRSYKSDITQYLTYLESHHPSTHINLLLNEKNLQIYADMLAHLATQSPATIERKLKTIRRFINWHTQSTPHPVMSDNIKIAANSHSYYPKAIAVPPTPSNPADNGSQTTATLNPSPDHNHISVKKVNYRKFRLPTLRSFISMAILLVLVSTLSIFTYRQFGREASLTAAFPNTPVTPNRQLSFQGRLENASGTPITSATNFVFKLYDASSGGTELYSSGTCSITPDTDGVFSTQIGGTCGSGISSSVFTENADVWLEVTVGAEILTPRQQIATVAYALNSETIQGFPISATVSAIRNTVVPMNQWGEIIVGEQSPRLTGVSGTFQISAPSLSLITATGTNGNITLAPDGTGQVNVSGNTTTTNFFNVSNAQLTTGSLITGTAANNNTGFNLLNLLSGSSPTSKFSVSDAGNVTLAGDLTITGGNITSATTFDSTLTSTGTLTANGTFDANGQLDLGDGGDTITINGSSITLTGFNCAANTNGGTLTTNGSGVLQCSDDDGGGSGGGSNWQSSLGTLSPVNSTWDVLVGGTATSSAKIGFININSGTPTINLANQASNIAVIDNTASALRILEGSNNYLSLTTTNSSENLSFGNTTTNPTYSFLGTGLTTLSGGLTVNGISTLGNNSATVEINSSDWDITTVGNMSGIGTISSDGDWTNSQATPTIFLTDSTASSDDYSINVDANAFNITNATDSRVELEFVGDGSINLGDNTTTKTIDIGGVTSSAIDAINIGTNATAADIISIGNNHATTTLALTGGTAWSMTTAGNLTTNNTTVNGNTVLGNAITDTIDFQGRVLQDADLIPITTTGTNDLGSSSLAWDNLYTNAAYFAGGTSFYVDASGNARFNDIIAADTANPGITVGDGSTGFLKVGSLTVGDNNASVVTFDTNSDATPEFQLYNTGSATASGDITMGGQLQVGRFAATPTALGAGTMIFNTTTNSFQCYNGTAWTSCGGTLFSNSNTSVADGSYITVTHNLASNDLLSNAWINAQGVWKSLDAAYKPAIAWEGKDTQKGVYHNNVNSYQPVGNETGTYTNTLHEGMVFDTFEDTTKTDSANTTISISTSLGDDGSSNFATLDQRIQNGRVGLMGGQTLSTGETDNDGQNYLGSNTVNDMYYYDRAKDSTPEVLVELGIDPNWYNGVTLSVATGSAQYSQAGTLADKNPNLTTTYNGSLIKVTGTDSTPRTIFITIKSPTTFDWTNYQGDAATGVTITPGTAQTLGSTGVSVTFTGGVTYNTGDVFKIASWYTEPASSTRGSKQQFPERATIIANSSGVDIMDADTQKLWMRFSLGGNYILGTGIPQSVTMLNGIAYVGSTTYLRKANFSDDSGYIHSDTAFYKNPEISNRNTATATGINTNWVIVSGTANSVSAAVIPNDTTKEVTVSGWGYVVGDSTNIVEETVVLPYKFNSNPVIVVSSGGYGLTTVPQSQYECNNRADTPVGQDAFPNLQTDSTFQANIVRSTGTFSSTAYYCYFWTATGTVSPKQFVAVATGNSTSGGTTIVNETDGSVAHVMANAGVAYSQLWQNKIALADNELYMGHNSASGNVSTLGIYHGVHGMITESSGSIYRHGLYGVGVASTYTPVILGNATGTGQITSLKVTPNTSTNGSNTIYVGTSKGVTVIKEVESNGNAADGLEESKGSVKYYTKDYISEEMIGDIRGMWTLNADNTASDLEDLSVKANNLTATNITAADSAPGVRGMAYDFNGTDEYLYRATDTDFDLSTSGITFGGWFKTTSSTSTLLRRQGNTHSTCPAPGTSSTNGTYYLALVSGSLYLGARDETDVTAQELIANRTINDNVWHHVIGVIDKSTSKLNIYIDGILDKSATLTETGTYTFDDGFTVGMWCSSTGVISQYYSGLMDDIFVTGTPISSSQARNMYQVGYRALQSHGTGLSSGTADSNQALAGASNNIGVVMPDYSNQFMYVGTNHTTDGALTKVQLNSDTAIKNWDTGDNDPDGGAQIVDDDITSLAVGETLYAVGSAASGIKSMGVDDNATATSGNFVSKTYTLPKNIGSAVLWASPILDGSDGSNTITVQASNDGGSNYVTCSLVNTNSNYSVPEKEYACTFTTADNDLKVRFQFARGSTKTNTYIVQYGISWLGETGFRVEQTDNNNVRLYNFSGETQNLRLNVTGGGTSVMANPWTDGGSYIYATGYETLRIYDGAGTNYLGLSHDGTYATLGYNGTDYLNLTSTGDLLPETNDTQALGSDTFRWEDVFLGPGSMHIGTSTTDEGVISYDTASNILNIGTDSTSNGDIAFFTDDLYLDKSTGNVAIGTASPINTRLAVIGDNASSALFSVSDGSTTNVSFAISDSGYSQFASTVFSSVFSCAGASCTSADSGTFTNNTTEAKTNSGTAFTTIGTGTTATFYVGLDHKFATLYENIATAAVGNTMVKEYWNGSAWTALSGVTDGTTNLTINGQMSWTVPSDWATKTVNSTSAYWIRLRSSTNVTTAPTVYSITPTIGTRFAVYSLTGNSTSSLAVTDLGITQFLRPDIHAGATVTQFITYDTSASNEYFGTFISDVDGTPDNEFLFRTDGTANADGSFTGGGADVAEYYYIDGGAEEGDLVSINNSASIYPEGKSLTKSIGAKYDDKVVGIVSTNPGLVAGGGDADTNSQHDNQKPIALAGRVPTKVNLEGGQIKKGDYLTSSSQPGVAMKANDSGSVIGQALEDYDGSVQLSPGSAIVEAERLALSPENLPLPLPESGIGKIMVFVNKSWHNQPLDFTKTGDLVYNNTLVNPYEVVVDGQTISANGNFAKTVTGMIEAGLASVQNLVTPNVQVATISPLSPEQDITITAPVTITPATPNLDTPTLLVDGEVDASTISARIARLETINTESLTARNIVADTITANTIVGLDAKIASLSAGISDSEFETISDRIKARLASLTGNDANAQDIPVPPSKPETIIEYNDLATASATLATADIDFATVNNYLAVIGSATITTLDITNGLYTNSIGSKDNLLAIQPLGGIVNIANNTFIVDSTGQVMVNGDLTVSGKILAGSANLGALEIGSPLDATVSSALGNLLAVYNEQGEAVATIDASGSANLATLTTQLVTIASGGSVATQSGLISSQTSSNSTAGASSLLSPDTERTIESPFVTPNSLVYLTPTTNTDNKVLFVKAKNTCDLNSLACTPSFTVGIDAPATTDIGFNWWIIELKQ